GWLDWLAEQSRMEWRVTNDPDLIGGAFIDWLPIASNHITDFTYEDGGNIVRRRVSRNARARYSRVRVTTPSDPGYAFAQDDETQRAIGWREKVVDYERGTPADAFATNKLNEVTDF